MSRPSRSITVPIDKAKAGLQSISSSSFTSLVKTASSRSSNASVLQLSNILANNAPKFTSPLFNVINRIITDTTLYIAWANYGLDYEISYSSNGGSVTKQNFTKDVRELSLTGLPPETNYTFTVLPLTSKIPIIFTYRTLPDSRIVQNFIIKPLSPNSIELNYFRPILATGVIVYYKSSSETTFNTALNLTSLSGLQPSTEYSIYTRAIINNAEAPASRTFTFTPLNIPTAITIRQISNITTTSVTLSYTKPQGVDSVNVYYKKDTDNSYISDIDLTTLSDLTPETSYQVYVTLIVNNVEYSPSTPTSFTTASIPGRISLQIDSITSNSARLSYPVPSTPDSHVNVYYKKATDVIYNVGTDLTELSNLDYLTAYSVYLTTVVSGQEYSPSIVATFITLAAEALVTNIRVSNITSNSAQIDYDPPAGISKVYVYFRRSIDTFPGYGENLSSLSGLVGSTIYYVSARAVGTNGRYWPMSDEIEFTTLVNPTTINDFSIINIRIYTASASYSKPIGASYVRVYYKPSTALQFDYIQDRSRLQPLLPGTQYQVYLTSTTNGTESPPSATKTFTTVPVPPAVDNIEISNITNNSATLAYRIPTDPGVENARVYYKKSTDPLYNRGINLTSLTGLQPSTVYNLYFTTYAYSEEHSQSQVISFTTLASVSAITDLVVSHVSYNYATLTYTRPPEAQQVKVYYKTQAEVRYNTLVDVTSLSGLESNTTYTVYVAAVIDGTEFAPTSSTLIKSFTTIINSGIVQNLVVSDVTFRTATLNYTAPPGATAVNVYYKESVDLNYTMTSGSSLSGLIGSTKYYVYTRSVISGVERDVSPIQEFTTLVDPDALNNLSIASVSYYNASFRFTTPQNATWIKAYWDQTPPSGSSRIVSGMFEAAHFNIYRSLNGFFNPNTTYSVYFTVIRSIGGNDIESTRSKKIIFTTLSIAANIADFILSDVTYNSVRLSYTNVQGSPTVKIYYRKLTDSSYTIGINLRNLLSLEPSTNYQVFLTSVGTNNTESAPSITRTFKTDDLPGAISDLDISNITSSSAVVGYTNIQGAPSARTYYKKSTDPNSSYTFGTDLRILLALNPSTSYDVYVTSIGSNNVESAPSGTQTFTTLASTAIISNVTISNVTNNSATLNYPSIIPGVTSVNVSYKKFADSTYTTVTNLRDLISLQSTTDYQVYLTPVTASGLGQPTGIITFTTLAFSPSIVDLALVSTTVNSITINYTKPDDASSVKVYYKKTTDTIYDFVSDLKTIYNLQPSTEYTIYVAAIKVEGESSPSSPLTQTTGYIPSVITSINITSITYNSAELSYTNPVGVPQVKVYYKKSVDTVYNWELAATSPTVTSLYDLQPSTTYNLYLTSLVNGQEYSPSSVRSFETLALPALINDLSATKTTVSSVTLNYKLPTGASEDVNIYYKKISESVYRRVTTKFKVLYGLSRSTEYNVYCTFIISGVESRISTNIIRVRTLDNAGSTLGGLVINDLRATGSTSDTISLSYTSPTNPTYSRYHTVIFYRKLETDTEFRSVVNASTIYGLQPSTTYEIFAASKFIIENFSTLNDPSPVISITTLPNSTIITDLSVRTLSYNFATIFYTKPSDADVRVYCKKSTDASYSNGLNLRTLSGLLPATTYNLYVTTVKGNDEGSPSNVLSFNTLSFPTSITNLAVKQVTHNSAIISYTNIPGANSIRIYCKKQSDANYSSIVDRTELINLEPSTTYDMYVTSLTGSTESAPSDVQSFKTLASASTLPIVLLTPVDSSNSVTSFTTSVRYIIPKPLNIVSYDIEVTNVGS